jgi:hypothetical protein
MNPRLTAILVIDLLQHSATSANSQPSGLPCDAPIGFAEADGRINPLGDGLIRDGPGARVCITDYQCMRTVGVGDY